MRVKETQGNLIRFSMGCVDNSFLHNAEKTAIQTNADPHSRRSDVLEGSHAHALGIYSTQHVTNRAILSTGVDRLE